MKNKNNLQRFLWTAGTAVLFVFFAAGPLGLLAGTGPEKPPAVNRMQPDHAPTPFSAEVIRSACPKGRKIVFQVEIFGQPLVYRTTTFGTPSGDGTVMESVTKGADGKQIGKRQMVIAKWKELQAHASFPENQTEIRSETYAAPAGTFDCWFYTVKETSGGKTHVKRFWFAKSLPGPPVCYEEEEEGRVVYRLKMLK